MDTLDTSQSVPRQHASAGLQGNGRDGNGLESRITEAGDGLIRTVSAVIEAIPGARGGPTDLARTLGIDKVLAGRVLKATGNRDPIAAVYLSPGPDPLRQLLRAASRRGVQRALIAQAETAVDRFDELIRHEAGDRSSLDAMLSAWLPEARSEFELRRKQAAFKANSQLKGSLARVNLATVMLHPSDDGRHLDVVWISGLLGLQRLRPGAAVKFATRRFADERSPRRPMSLRGEPVETLEGVRVDEFCSQPPPRLEITRVNDVVHYALAGDDFGPRSAVDLVFAEVNRREIARYVPADSARKGYVFAEVGTPSRTLHFDVLVHQDVYPGSDPDLFIYDTAFEGVADINDPTRDIDRLATAESIQHLGAGAARFRSGDVPNYAELVRHACAALRWTDADFRGFRCRIEYPIYGTQVAMAFDPPHEQ